MRLNDCSERTSRCEQLAIHRRAFTRRHPISQSFRNYQTTRSCHQQEIVNRPVEQDANLAPGEVSRPVAEGIGQDDDSGWLEDTAEPEPEQGQQEDASYEESEQEVDSAKTRTDSRILSDKVRSLMRLVPSSVAIVTAFSTDPETKEPVPLGSAISSLNTVALDPPHVSFNIKYPSRTLDGIRASKGLFRVHFLQDSRVGSWIAHHFTTGNTPDALQLRKRALPLDLPHPQGKICAPDSLAPQIRHPAVVAAMECEVTQEVTIADHVIVVAKVNSLKPRRTSESTLLYQNGKYRSYGNLPIYAHELSTKSNVSVKDVDFYWKYPLFPGEMEKQDFLERLEAHIKSNPSYYEMETKDALILIRKSLNIPSGVFGIDQARLIERCKIEAGFDAGTSVITSGNSALTLEFYGRLTPLDVATITERAKEFVRRDPEAPRWYYKKFLASLGLHSRSTGWLASDIMGSLRAENLVAPSWSGTLAQQEGLGSSASLEDLEHLEHMLRDFYETRSYKEACQRKSKQLARIFGVNDSWIRHISLIRVGVVTKVYADKFSSRYIDISGEITPAESRVIVSRVVSELDYSSFLALKRYFKIPLWERLRRIGVHPLFTGIDVSFLMGKLKFLLTQVRTVDDFTAAVDEMLKPLLRRKDFELVELRPLVQRLVHTETLHLVKWSRKDQLAAMGIDHRARISTSVPTTNPHLLDNDILPTLLAKEFRSYYNNSASPDEKEAIVWYLNSSHDYDVHSSSSDTFNPLVEKSSAKEVREAMMRSLHSPLAKQDPFSKGRETEEVTTHWLGAKNIIKHV